ncbi:MAG TPA: type 4a pilus biogenesis protein PilO [Gallionella sp.]|nr:type 4a pilus biogenesis protein PilO [Gallionella sp.]
MSKAEWILSRWAKRLGMSGLAGMVLVALSLGIILGFTLPAETRLKDITSEVAELQRLQKAALSNPVAPARSVESDLVAFYKSLPPERNVTKLLDEIYKSANSASLRLNQGEYKYTREKAGRLENYQLILPVKGSYVQVRKFIAKVLNGLPAAALNGVSFKRETIGTSDLEAKIQFTIYLGAV